MFTDYVSKIKKKDTELLPGTARGKKITIAIFKLESLVI